MPPPPPPARARIHARANSGKDTTHSPFVRRHTVAASSSSDTIVPSPAPPAQAPIRSQSSGAEVVPAQRPTNAMLTTHMNDALWSQSQQFNRLALVETFRQRHGREPPPEMRILETSAIERSLVGENALRRAMEREWAERADKEDKGGQEGAREKGRNRSVGPTALEDMSNKEFFRRGPDPNWIPAHPGAELELEAALEESARANPALCAVHVRTHSHGDVPLVSPISPNTPDEIATPRESFFPTHAVHAYPSVLSAPQTEYNQAYRSPITPMSPSRASFLIQKIAPLLRHDGHLVQHISGLGGAHGKAYDGRSYLPDDAEPDPSHVPPAPPGARISDHPILKSYRPHPLAIRGEKLHTVINPAPERPTGAHEKGPMPGNSREPEGANEDARPSSAMRRREEAGVKKEEKGKGWGSAEGGSHGPGFGLGLPISKKDNGGCADGPGDRGTGPLARLKLTTDEKAPLKMACLFCRNRKIACGIGKGEDKTCNQCSRRNLRCIFPTESRRGMRTRKGRSAHTVDGVDEAVKDTTEPDEPDFEEFGDASSSSSAAGPSGSRSRRVVKNRKKQMKAKVRRKKVDGKGKGKGKEKAGPEEDEECERDEDEDGDIVMGDGGGDSTAMQVNRSLEYADNPLALLAAEMRHQRPRPQQPTSSSSSSYSSPMHTTSSAAAHATLAGSSMLAPGSLLGVPPQPGPPDASSMVGAEYSATQISGLSRGPFTTSPLSRRKQGRGGGDRGQRRDPS
ncbi:hypothetical protein DFH11DRAFT_1648174 [Phellopilus nigrolimitatus]|nr:hypothetical protein DFH11DRAFT_1648174 [Phellopilus nigrolimitatus]